MQSLQRMSGNRSAPGLTRRLQVWWALRSQKRRRDGGSGTPAAPAIVTHNLAESTGEPLYWFDVVLDFTFEQGRFPDGTIEVYWARQSTGWVESYLGAVSSNARSFRQVRAFSDFEGDVVAYRMRYRCGTETIGPFSQSYGFEYVAP